MWTCSLNVCICVCDAPHSAGLLVAGSVGQDEGGVAERPAAGVCWLGEVQAAAQHHEVVSGDGDHPADISAGRTSRRREIKIHL